MKLKSLLEEAGIIGQSTADTEVGSVVYDSRKAGPGSLFVAIPGAHVDGHAFAAAAVALGAVGVLAQHECDPPIPSEVPQILVAESRAVLSKIAAILAGNPSAALTVCGVTGTDGKTTTTSMVHAAWQGSGITAASMTTVDFRFGKQITPNKTRQTTLESPEIQQALVDFRDGGCTHVAMEVSSHALALHRVSDVTFRCATFTKITSEHLDFHGNRQGYLNAKAELARMVSARPDGVTVLDLDDEFAYPVLSTIPVARRLTYSASGNPAADLVASDLRIEDGGLHFTAKTPWGQSEVALKFAGRFNASNSMAALASACATGAKFDDAVAGISSMPGVNGRMEPVDLGQPFSVVVDYAHTAEAFATVLPELRLATRGKLWVVFGSAGERDHEKRGEMGEVAARLADFMVVTDEDPREEDRHAILEDIAHPAEHSGAVRDQNLFVIPDRTEAINFAISHASSGDLVLLAGKGHESCIIVGREQMPWNEREVAETAIKQVLATA